ncbi:MAG: MFS transporter, partial [Candidatus Dormibacteraeota bacterium]|nr:MFS transporter [Candidatus Dormibacteraeota bacterium]
DLSIGNLTVIHQGGISPVWPLIAIGALFVLWFFLHIRNRERAQKEPLVSISLFRNRTSNLGLATQNIQWLLVQGASFAISVFLQEVRKYSAVETGLILSPAMAGILVSSALAGRLARRRSQTSLIRGGFVLTWAGMLLMLFLGGPTNPIASIGPGLWPGLLLIGLAVGFMLPASVNVVQSAFPEAEQGEISGVSRSVSNLGSSLGTAIVGSVLVSSTAPDGGPFAAALVTIVIISMIGVGAALLLPAEPPAASTRGVAAAP